MDSQIQKNKKTHADLEGIDFMSNEDARGFLYTMIELVQKKDPNLADMLRQCELEFEQTTTFTYKRFQCEEFIIIRHPVRFLDDLKPHKHYLHGVASLIYEETDAYALSGIKFKIQIIKGIQSNQDEDEVRDIQHLAKAQVYENLLNKVHNHSSIHPIEKTYIVEACECAKRDYRLAAATMLGCAAEHALIRLTEAFFEYLQNHDVKARELENYKSKVLKASKISIRLTEFLKYVPAYKPVFTSLGLEHPERTIPMYFEPIRLIRNDSGHPTGKVVSPEDLNTEFNHYQLLMDAVYHVIEELTDPFIDLP